MGVYVRQWTSFNRARKRSAVILLHIGFLLHPDKMAPLYAVQQAFIVCSTLCANMPILLCCMRLYYIKRIKRKTHSLSPIFIPLHTTISCATFNFYKPLCSKIGVRVCVCPFFFHMWPTFIVYLYVGLFL